MLKPHFLLLLLFCFLLAESASWHPPQCSAVTGGAGALTFTTDDGKTLAPTPLLTGISYTYGLAAFNTPNQLVAEHDGKLFRSNDAGCSWRTSGPLPESLIQFTTSVGNRVFGWRPNGNTMVRITPAAVKILKSPSSILGMAIDPRKANHVRLGGGDGSIWDSKDNGITWKLIGQLRTDVRSDLLLYVVAFDPNNLDHVLAGMANQAAYYSEDGGVNWRKSNGFSTGRNGENVFNIVVSPAASSVVWAMGLNLAQSDNGAPSQGRHIYRSDDGGKNFKQVISQNSKVILINGPLLVAHPVNPDILYFVFGTFFQGYGTDLYRYDFGSRKLTKTHNSNDGIDSIAFSPSDPAILYLGLTAENGID